MRSWLPKFYVSERGATAIEYALLAGFIAVVILAAVNSIGTTLNGTFANVAAGF